jgi:small neutral amino acid transporter SnatA (MarC family)
MHGTGTTDAFAAMPNTVLLAITALFSIVNPLVNAIIFNQMTADRTHSQRLALARRVGLYSFGLMLFAIWVGSYVLNFFGITLGALKVAGGLVIAVGAWRLLHAPERREAEKEAQLHQGGRTATRAMTRLFALILLCLGVQIVASGIATLLLPVVAAARG